MKKDTTSKASSKRIFAVLHDENDRKMLQSGEASSAGGPHDVAEILSSHNVDPKLA